MTTLNVQEQDKPSFFEAHPRLGQRNRRGQRNPMPKRQQDAKVRRLIEQASSYLDPHDDRLVHMGSFKRHVDALMGEPEARRRLLGNKKVREVLRHVEASDVFAHRKVRRPPVDPQIGRRIQR